MDRRAGRLRRLAALLAVFAAPSAVAHPQSGAFTLTEVSPGVWFTVQPDPLASPVQGNTTAIVTDRDVIVVDANIYPSMTREVIAAIRRVTDKPVRYLVNTHAHSDHHYGNSLYREAWPGVEIVSHPLTRLDIIETDLPTFEPNWRTNYPAQAVRLRGQLAADTAADGKPLSEAQRARLLVLAEMYERASREWQSLALEFPTLTVADSLVLHRGDRRVVIRHLGRGNTRGDLIVELPEQRVVITGDLLVAPIPFAFNAFLADWIVTLERLRAIPATVILPGHGPPMTDWGHLDRVHRLLVATWRETQAAVAAGLDLPAVQQRITLDSLRVEFAGDDATRLRAFEGFFRLPALAQAFKDARGEPRERP